MAVYDVIVMGVGGMGSAAAYHLAGRRARVLGIEQFGIAHDRGSSHGRTRVIRQAYYEGPDYVPLLFRAYDLWHALEREAGTTLLTKTGALHLGAPDAEGVVGAARSARMHRIPHAMLTAEEIRTRYPVLRPAAGQVALLEYEAGILNPEQVVRTHIDLARRHGADLHFEEAVVSWTAGPTGVSVRTTPGTYQAGRLVITAGPWTDQALRDLGVPLEVARAVLYWFEPRAHVEEFKRLPIYLWEDHGNYAYGFPYLDGQGLKIAFHHVFAEVTTPQTIRRQVGDDEVARIREHVAKVMPDAPGALLATATCMYTNTPDLHFILDRHPAHDNVIVACGFSGHGFKFASVVGEVLADLALQGTTAQPIELFALRRFREPGGLTGPRRQGHVPGGTGNRRAT
ncbi:MAG TPA: N-methyl-L-tryptophan oxidase [bacterium]|nr:N-methyl-L-tryptophan oxidase [bacterium]